MIKDFCKYADVFYGNGEVDHFPESGLISKWFYIKALGGNTNPSALLPFGKISVGAYSGGYPAGYGTHKRNWSGGIEKFSKKMKIKGFSHLHQSGVGEIQYYYNYAVVTPFYGKIAEAEKYHELENEYACPGYYKAEMNNVLCEVTADRNCAFHRYKFKKADGRVLIDFSNDGLNKIFPKTLYSEVKNAEIKLESDDKVYFSGIFSGIKLYFCALGKGRNVKISAVEKSKVVYDFDGDEFDIVLSYSTLGFEKAEENVITSANKKFDDVKDEAYSIWNEHLSKIEIETDDEELKEKFYSNFYHSLVKPVDMTGEEVLGIKGDLVVDFATFWDQYKTALPLIFMLYDDMGEKIAKAIVNMSRTLGKIPCSLGLTDMFTCEEQAKMLGILVLCDAYHFGVKSMDKTLIDECVKRELEREDFKEFLENGLFERYTHVLDTTDACLDVAEITDDDKLKERLIKLAENWINVYNKEDGIMSEKSKYYEGDRYTYSFRLQKNIEERIKLAGGKEKFVKMLDDFFGFGKESLKQLTYIGALDDIRKTSYHRFEGFNNECDMEAPYAYIYADRHDRTCDIVRECVRESFTTGRGALPGNNDSGGLSSCFMWNALGIFPVSGSGDFLLGVPQVESARISLSNGKQLRIKACGDDFQNKYVKKVEFNGKEVNNFRIHIEELMSGGELVFYMD